MRVDTEYGESAEDSAASMARIVQLAFVSLLGNVVFLFLLPFVVDFII